VDTSVANNRPLCLRLPWEKGWPDAAGVVVPRLNGDGTVTFSAAVSMARPARGENATTRQFTAIRRLAKGQGWVLGSGNPDIAWLVVFREVAPDAAQ
jgi:hypothetical protein